MQKPLFAQDNYYHIYNRGVEKRTIFLDDFDRFRFIHDLFEFNDTAPAGKFSKGRFPSASKQSEVEPPIVIPPRIPLVKIHCFCLMPNHYHMLVEQVRDGGIIAFMKKLGTGYTMYFNEKYDRVGPLFQGRFKAVHVTEETHLRYLPLYIHLNPLDHIMPSWREQKIISWRKAEAFLNAYRWSSHLDYAGRRNFPSVTSRRFLHTLFDGERGYRQHLKEWLRERDIAEISPIILE